MISQHSTNQINSYSTSKGFPTSQRDTGLSECGKELFYNRKKLGRCLCYLWGSKELVLALEADGSGAIQWWIDASFTVSYLDMKSHTGITMSLVKGSPFSSSISQKLNMKSSTAEAELVGMDDGMPLVIWTRNFMIELGYNMKDNVVYQDNQSAILLERNGRALSG